MQVIIKQRKAKRRQQLSAGATGINPPRLSSYSDMSFIRGGVYSGAAMLVFGIADYPLSYSRIMMLFWILFGLLASDRKIDS